MTYNTTVQYARVLELIKQGARINEKEEVIAPAALEAEIESYLSTEINNRKMTNFLKL